MRTEQDLRESLQLLADRAALAAQETEHAEQAAVRLASPARRRRVLAVALLAATAVVAALLLPQTVRDRTAVDPAPPTSPGGPPPFVLPAPSGWTYDQATLNDRYWAVEITTAQWRCRVVAYPAGGFDEAKIRARVNIRIGGLPGYSALVPDPGSKEDGPRFVRAVVWEYAARAWVLTTCEDDHGALYRQGPAKTGSPQDQLSRRMAATVDFGQQSDPRAPVRFGYLPPGYRLSKVERRPWGLAGRRDQPSYGVVASGPRSEWVNQVVVRLERGETELPKLGERMTLGGYPARLDKDRTLRVRHRGYHLTIDLTLSAVTDPRAELLRIYQELTLAADPWKRATWLPSDVGL